MAQKIILDCDPGHDDAIAMMLAWGNPNIDLLAVTTVVGNQTLEKVSRNALAVAENCSYLQRSFCQRLCQTAGA